MIEPTPWAKRMRLIVALWAVSCLISCRDDGPASQASTVQRAGPGAARGPVVGVGESGSSSAHCAPHGAWRSATEGLPHTNWQSLVVGDYSGASSQGCFPLASPASLRQVQEIVKRAAESALPIRIRGGGHSMNLSSLPRTDELLLSTAKLNEVRYENAGEVVAQAGVSMHALQRELRLHNLQLPVINDGWSGPTVGGFVSAGGQGSGSLRHGGFWENVAAITLVDGRGVVRTLKRDDDDFLWLFGSMGQLGIIVEATLDVVAGAAVRKGAKDPYTEKRIHRIGDPPAVKGPSGPRRFWFTLLVGADELKTARRELDALQRRYSDKLEMLPGYVYEYRDRGRAPPLFFGRSGAITAVGIWVDTDSQQAGSLLNDEVTALCERYGFRRYIQAEVPQGPQTYERYFGETTYAAWRGVKHRFDPKSLFNRGTAFPSPPVR